MFSRVRRELQVDGKTFAYYSLPELQDARVERLPYSVRVLLESAVRNCDDFAIKPADVDNILNWETTSKQDIEIPFKPARVILQDFTGVPAVVDLAAMRDAMKRLGGDPERINPLVPADLVIDHSVQVDVYGTPDAYEKNQDIEFERNEERFRFLKWGAQAFKNMLIVPPGSGIVHQVNLEYLARAVFSEDGVLYPDSVVGTDSHTTMINGLGIVGWGVGGIEAEAVMLGQAISMVLPQVVGFKLTGKLPEVATATDLVLTVTQMLRAKGVVGKFVEFFGPGCANLSIADRATISNMAPEYGATIGYFPPDEQTIEYMRTTGRDEDKLKYIEAYLRAQHMFRNYAAGVDPVFSDQLELDLATVEPCMSGPKRPHDRVLLSGMKADFVKCLTNKPGFKGFGVPEDKKDVKVTFNFNGHDYTIQQGAVVIASITSCTNTSNPSVLIGAGLLAKNAIEAGLNVKPFVKTSLSPGSLAVSQYLQEAGLQTFLDKLGFTTAGYGCMTCIAAGTPVLLANGTACRINKFSAAGGASLLSPFADGKLARASQTALLDNGVRDCVRLTFQDGRTLVCTPDHRLLCADDRWVAAGDLSLNKDRVVAGLEAPLDEPADDEAGYELLVGQRLFTMDAPADRQRALAFVRLLGHLLCDGSIGALKQGRLHVAHAVDRDAVLQDIELLTRERPAASQHDERTWAIILPTDLTADIIAVVGERIEQVPRLPAFILDERCPVAVVREFLGGVFGADGQGPVLRRVSQVAEFVHPMLSQSASPEHADALEDVMRDLLRLLTRCGVETAKAKIYRRSTSTPRVEVRLALTDGLSFVERVGFRYCVDKTMRASAASVYWRTIAKTPCMTSPAKVLEQLGVREWFAPRAKRNGVNKTGDRLPTFSLSVINRRCAGPHPVFDLTVEGPHAFIAGGVAVHNCIGNSGPLPEAVAEAIEKEDLVAAAVLSGNRNFEGRVNPHTKANYLASPPLCVAYALAGTVNIDFKTEPIGTSVATGKPVFLSDIWPSRAQIQAVVDKVVQPQMFKKSYSVVTTANPRWNALTPPAGRLYEWDVSSTYIKCPPFFNAVTKDLPKHGPIKGAHALLNLGDSITTDHISPAGNIARNSAAARFLASKGVSPRDFNSYGSRRGNDEVMARGTFANTQITNKMIGKPGPKTVHVPSGEVLDTYDAAERYIRDGVPLIVLAGAEYGSGSSRDWAAKGPYLQGIKAVIAISYERIHRSNLVGMGIIPLQFPAGQNADTLGLTGKEQFDIDLPDNIQPGMDVTVRTSDGKTFQTKLRFDTEVELTYFKNGGILQYMLRKLSV